MPQEHKRVPPYLVAIVDIEAGGHRGREEVAPIWSPVTCHRHVIPAHEHSHTCQSLRCVQIKKGFRMLSKNKGEQPCWSAFVTFQHV